MISIKRHLPFVMALSLLMAVVALAQTPPPPRSSAPAPAATPTPSAGGTGLEGKIGILWTAAFNDGLLEYKAKLEALEAEFAPAKKEMQSLTERLERLKNQVQTQGNTVAATVRNKWMEEGADLEKQIKRKEEDLQAETQKRANEVLGPVQDKIQKALEQYTTKRGIIMVIEAGAAQQNGLILYAADAVNITKDFIDEYNKANPVTAPSAVKK